MWEQGDIALGSASFIGYRPGLLLGGLSPPTFKSGGAQAPPAPPISPPLIMYEDLIKKQFPIIGFE